MLDKLTAEELDDLIQRAVEQRKKVEPAVTLEFPTKDRIGETEPVWALTYSGSFSILDIRHPGHGWITLVLSKQDRVKLVGDLQSHVEKDQNEDLNREVASIFSQDELAALLVQQDSSGPSTPSGLAHRLLLPHPRLQSV